MVSVVEVVLLLVVCGGLTRGFPVQEEPLLRRGLSSGSVEEVHNSYYTVSNKKEENEELNVVSHVQRMDLNRIKYSQIYDINGDAYLLLKTSRHRNKRYTSYLTLCPFKICNMGRKRTRARRYIEPIRVVGDNEGT